MSKPTPGKTYVVLSGDTLGSIAAKAYGDSSKWTVIKKSNAGIDPDVLKVGDSLIIPSDPAREKLKAERGSGKMSGKDPDSFTLVIDNMEIPVMSARVLRTMDTASDAWTASLDWEAGKNIELDKRIKPYTYGKASVYLGDAMVINGLLYRVGVDFSTDGCVKHLEGYSFTADIVDSSVTPPYEHNNITLKNLAKALVVHLGLSVEFDANEDGVFSRVTADNTETIFSFLSKLSVQRGVLISSTRSGNLLFHKAKTSGAPVATLEEGRSPVIGLSAEFDGRDRFNIYRCIGPAVEDVFEPGTGVKMVGVAKDTSVPRSRVTSFMADDTISGNVTAAARWRRSSQVVKSLEMQIPVSSWYDPDGNLWRENTLVILKSKSLHIPNGFKFLIKSVEYSFDSNGTTAVLNLIPPQVYTGEQIKEPWA